MYVLYRLDGPVDDAGKVYSVSSIFGRRIFLSSHFRYVCTLNKVVATRAEISKHLQHTARLNLGYCSYVVNRR